MRNQKDSQISVFKKKNKNHWVDTYPLAEIQNVGKKQQLSFGIEEAADDLLSIRMFLSHGPPLIHCAISFKVYFLFHGLICS